jgi:hypothetical protein
MEVAEFEQDILKLAFETDARITTASVAYYLGLPSSKVEPMLDKLLEKGVLELDSDDEGNLFYRVPEGARRQAEMLPRLKQDRQGASSANGADDAGGPLVATDAEQKAADAPSGPSAVDGVASATARPDDSQDDIEPLNPKSHRPDDVETNETYDDGGVDGGLGSEDIPAESPVVGSYGTASQTLGEKRQVNGAVERGSAEAVFGTVTRRQAATDASVDGCGDSTVVADTEAQCEPRPIADSQPTFTSCNDSVSSEKGSTSLVQSDKGGTSMERFYYDTSWNGAEQAERGQPAAGATAGAAAAGGRMMHHQEGKLDQPEHQPGMSLLLSLVLCGTGQIYNGEVSKGIMMMVLCFLLWLIFLGWVVHIWSIVDSVIVAERINRDREQ